MGGRNTLTGAVLALVLGLGSLAAPGGEPSTEQCSDTEVCPIPYVRLAKQETEPFLFLGKVVNENHPRHEDYDRALRRFPDVRSCLTEDERNKPQPDLREIDWDEMRNVRDVDVCVFRIASSIQDVDRIKNWLRHQGFTVGEMSRRFSESYTPRYATEPAFGLQAHMSVDRFRKIFPKPWITILTGVELLRNYWLTISFSQEYQIVDVSSGGNTILN